MEKPICCPKCQSEEVRSFDNEPLLHPSKAQVETDKSPRYDNEVYVKFKCDACNDIFTKVFTLTLQK